MTTFIIKKLPVMLITALLATACTLNTTFHVSTQGDDSGTGSLSSPWATPEHAVSKACEWSRSHPGRSVTLRFDGGEYRLHSTISIDSICGPMALKPRWGKHPVFAGDVPVGEWEEWRGGIYSADLKTCGITDYGCPAGRENRIDLYAGGRRQNLARWPDGNGFSILGKAVGPTIGKCRSFIGEYECRMEGIMEYVDPHIDSWAAEKDPWVLGYWYWDWYEEYKSVSAVDTVGRILYLEPAGHLYGYRDSARFYGVNMLCELDSPGEYYIDRECGLIYWYPEGGCNDAVQEDTRVSVFPEAEMIEADGIDGLEIIGIRFRGGRGGAIAIKGGSANAVRRCRINGFAQTAIRIEGGSGHIVSHCRLSQLGAAGIIASGGDRHTLTSSGLVVRGNTVEDFALYKHTYEPAVGFEGVGAKICRNSFRNSTSSAISLRGNDIVVQFNRFENLVRESDDQGALESFGDLATRRLIIRYNVWKNINGGTKYGAAAVRFDDFISGNEVYCNVFSHCGSLKFGAVQIHGGRDNIVRSNIMNSCNYAVSCSPWTFEAYREKYSRFRSRWEDIDLQGELYTSRYPELLEPVDSLNQNRNFVRGNLIFNTPRLYRNGMHLVTSGNLQIPRGK